MHGAVQPHVPVWLGPSVANAVFHLAIVHFVLAMHLYAVLRHFSRCTTNALRKGHVHVNGLDAAVWWHSSLAIRGAAIRVISLTVPNVQMNCIGGVPYALNSVSNDVF